MSKRCDLTGIGVLVGNNVSHSNKKSKRVFEPNLQTLRLTSDALKRKFSLKVSVSTLRSIDKLGGLDGFLLGTANSKLTESAQVIKRRIKKSLATQQTGNNKNDPKKSEKAA